MHNLSYSFDNKPVDFNNFELDISIFTFENIYGLSSSACIEKRGSREYSLTCSRFTWAGGQESLPGNLDLEIKVSENSSLFKIDVSFSKKIRCIKLTLKNIEASKILNLREGEEEITDRGLNLTYPDGWRGLYTPLVVLNHAKGGYIYFRSLDKQVREKRFALSRNPDNTVNVELIFEENATEMVSEISVPAWEVGFSNSQEDIYDSHKNHIEKSYNPVNWAERKDVPDWFREISLIASIHCQHFTGYIFNDYPDVLKKIEWLRGQIDGRRILVYLPGWEGRYYWQYGDYRPDPRMGGEKEFKKMIDRAHELGVHVMPMFGINYANKNLDNFEQWGNPACTLSAGGFSHGESVDWDTSRHYDHGWGAELNPGAPTWRNRLISMISGLIKKYKFDGVFLDIASFWKNDPKYNVFKGIEELTKKLKDKHPEIIIGGEGWYDGFSAVLPLHQSGHTEGVLHWHDQPYSPLFEQYNRAFGHLCLGAPGSGSTGVHELGYNKIQKTPYRRGIIPTVTMVDNTIEEDCKLLAEIIADSKRYASEFL